MDRNMTDERIAKIKAARAGREGDDAGVADDIAGVFKESIEMQKTINSRLQQQSKVTDEVSARLMALEQYVVSDNFGSVGGGTPQSMASRAIDELQDNNAYAALKDWNVGTARVKMQAGIRAALVNDGKGGVDDTGVPGQPARHGMVAPVQRALRLLDVLPSRPVTADAVEFVQLTATGSASEQDNEGDEKAAIEVEGALRRVEIATIAAHTTASRQVLSDHAALQANIDAMIRNKLLSRLEHQIINGTGQPGKILGLLEQALEFTPTIAETPADIVGEALMRQADSGYQPNLVVMNPMDWFRIQVTRKAAGEEEYVFGSPTMPITPALWNVSIVTTPSIAQGTAMTVDTAFTTVLDREEPSILLSNSHKDYFTRNLVAILGELRAGLEVLDTSAIYKLNLETSGG